MVEKIQFVSLGREPPLSEKWYLDHMGVMAFWRTVMGVVNIVIAGLIALKVFELI